MFIEAIFRIVFPKAPAWLGGLIATAIPAVHQLVLRLKHKDDMRGEDKRVWVVSEVTEILDDAFDDVPEWAELSEEARDRILSGLAELSLWVSNLAGELGPKKSRRLLRKSLAKLG